MVKNSANLLGDSSNVGKPMKKAKNRNSTPAPRKQKKCISCCPDGNLRGMKTPETVVWWQTGLADACRQPAVDSSCNFHTSEHAAGCSVSHLLRVAATAILYVYSQMD